MMLAWPSISWMIRWIPKGVSVWELGTSDDPKEKASKDYKGRSANGPKLSPSRSHDASTRCCRYWIAPNGIVLSSMIS
jgi:hypothetical protein